MSSEPGNAKQIFLEAIERHAPDRWPAYLDQACDDDAQLRRRVEILLEAHVAEESLLDGPAMSPAATIDQPICEKPGTVIGPYKLLQRIGEGGMGVVYMAEQAEPIRRRVALKIIKPGMDTKQVIARFEAERQALAMMDHPNIATVLDAGATDSGRPYFVLELVKGVAITKYCDMNELSTEDRLTLFLSVCRAVQHAHQKGIIHRDIKPSNILVTLHDGTPVPKIIDFGVSKAINLQLTEKTLFTTFGQIVGTPQYMSPEQAEMSGLDVDTRSDVYSLGVVLYELLTGSTPLEGERLRTAGYAEMQRIIQEEDPSRPSVRLSTGGEELTMIAKHRAVDPRRLQQTIRGELDWIVMKSLEKDRRRRYEGPSALAADVERFLTHEAVEACPPSTLYQIRKFVHRNRLSIGATIGVSLALVLGIVGTTIAMVLYRHEAHRTRAALVEAQEQRTRAEEEAKRADKTALAERVARERLRRQAYALRIGAAYEAWGSGNLERARQMLVYCGLDKDVGDPRGFEWRYLWEACDDCQPTSTLDCDGIIEDLAFYPPDSRYLAIAQRSGAIVVRDMVSQNERILVEPRDWRPEGSFTTWHTSVVFSEDGQYLVARSYEEEDTGSTSALGNVYIWEWPSGHRVGSAPLSSRSRRLALSPDGKYGASADHDGAVTVWTLPGGDAKWRLPAPSGGQMEAAGFAPHCPLLVTSCSDDTLRVWNLDRLGDEKLVQVLPTDGTPVHAARWAPDGRYFALASNIQVKLWKWDGEKLTETPRRVGQRAWGLSFSPDSRMLALATAHRTVNLWDVTNWRQTHRFIHEHAANSVTWSRDSRRLASGGLDEQVYFWGLESGVQDAWPGKRDYFLPLDVSINGTICTTNQRNEIVLWGPTRGEAQWVIGRHDKGVLAVAFDHRGKRLASVGVDGVTKLWDVVNRQLLQSWENGGHWAVAFSPDGESLVSVNDPAPSFSNDTDVRLFNLVTQEEMMLEGHDWTVLSVDFSPDGRYLAVAGGIWCSFGETKLWKIDEGPPECVATLRHLNRVYCVRFSPNSRTLAVTHDCLKGTVKLWDLDCQRDKVTLRERVTLAGHCMIVSSHAFTPDGRRLVTGSADGTIKFWDTRSGEQLGSLNVGEQIRNLEFFPDGNTLVTASTEGWIRLWRGPPTDGTLSSAHRTGFGRPRESK